MHEFNILFLFPSLAHVLRLLLCGGALPREGRHEPVLGVLCQLRLRLGVTMRSGSDIDHNTVRLLTDSGYDEGVAGHITVRDPEFSDHFWVNPIGVHFGQIKVSDLLLVNHEGDIVQGDRSVNIAAFTIHSRLHMARPDVNAAAHSHSMYGKTFATLGKLLDPISQDSCAFYERQAIYDDFSGVSDDTSEGERIANALGDKQVLIIQKHFGEKIF